MKSESATLPFVDEGRKRVIIELATDTQQPLSVLLRSCILLGYELKNESLQTWANQELNGYTEP